MTGVPGELLMPTDFVTLRMGLVDAVGFDAAILLERVRWRCEVRPEGWVATYADLQRETRLSRNRVHAATAVLRERGWLLTENAGEGSRTLRWLVPVSPIVPNQDDGGGIVPDPVDHSPESGLCSSYRENLDNSLFVIPGGVEGAPKVDDAVLVEFQGFWAAYPKKTDKPAALRAFRKARKTTPVDVIAAGLRKILPVWAVKDRQYIPNPATWLNGERWADDVTPVGDPPVADPNAWMRRTPRAAE